MSRVQGGGSIRSRIMGRDRGSKRQQREKKHSQRRYHSMADSRLCMQQSARKAGSLFYWALERQAGSCCVKLITCPAHFGMCLAASGHVLDCGLPAGHRVRCKRVYGAGL